MKKTRLQLSHQRQKVTGIKVNEKLNVVREYILKLRSMLYNFREKDVEEATAIFLKHYNRRNKREFIEVKPLEIIRGMINYVSQIKGKDDTVVMKFINEFNRIPKPDDIRDIMPHEIDSARFKVAVYKIDVEAYSFTEKTEKTDDSNMLPDAVYTSLIKRMATDFKILISDNNLLEQEVSSPKEEKKYKNITEDTNFHENIEMVDSDFLYGVNGTGFLLEDGRIITCAHVFDQLISLHEDSNLFDYVIKIQIFNPYNNELVTEKDIEIVSVNSDIDISICKFKDDSIFSHEGLSINENQLNKGDKIRLLGFPQYQVDGSYIDNYGYIIGLSNIRLIRPIYDISKESLMTNYKQYIINENIYEGNRGGPVLNSEGEVIGIAARGVTSNKVDGNLVIPICYLNNINYKKIELEKIADF